MTRQTWTAFVSALAFICLAVLLVVVPVPFVSWGPGGTRDTLGNVGNEPMIKVQDIDTYPTTGRLDMTIVAITPAMSNNLRRRGIERASWGVSSSGTASSTGSPV